METILAKLLPVLSELSFRLGDWVSVIIDRIPAVSFMLYPVYSFLMNTSATLDVEDKVWQSLEELPDDESGSTD